MKNFSNHLVPLRFGFSIPSFQYKTAVRFFQAAFLDAEINFLRDSQRRSIQLYRQKVNDGGIAEVSGARLLGGRRVGLRVVVCGLYGNYSSESFNKIPTFAEACFPQSHISLT